MADGAPQIWDVPVTPAQRWALVQLAFHKDAPQVTDRIAGKRLRRALRAFGLMEIRDVLRAHDSKISSTRGRVESPALHRITVENLEVALGWAAVPRHPSVELDAGDLFDLLETIKADPIYTPPAGVPEYSDDGAAWRPTDDEIFELTCPACKQRFGLDELGTPRQP